jgi:hypothetical protein
MQRHFSPDFITMAVYLLLEESNVSGDTQGSSERNLMIRYNLILYLSKYKCKNFNCLCISADAPFRQGIWWPPFPRTPSNEVLGSSPPRLLGPQVAVKISYLLGRSRLRCKRGRFFSVWNGVAIGIEQTPRFIGPPLELFEREKMLADQASGFWALWKGDYEWQSTMWRL